MGVSPLVLKSPEQRVQSQKKLSAFFWLSTLDANQQPADTGRSPSLKKPGFLVVGQFARSAARLLAAAGLLFLKVTHYRFFSEKLGFCAIRRPGVPGVPGVLRKPLHSQRAELRSHGPQARGL